MMVEIRTAPIALHAMFAKLNHVCITDVAEEFGAALNKALHFNVMLVALGFVIDCTLKGDGRVAWVTLGDLNRCDGHANETDDEEACQNNDNDQLHLLSQVDYAC